MHRDYQIQVNEQDQLIWNIESNDYIGESAVSSIWWVI